MNPGDPWIPATRSGFVAIRESRHRLGGVEIVGYHEDDEGRRYRKPLVPHGVPQPGFWHPTF